MVPAPPVTEAGQPRPRTWRTLLLVFGIVLLATLAAASLWYTGTGDLRAVTAEARSRGHATTWEELGRAASPPEHLTINRRLRELSGSMRLYQLESYHPLWHGQETPEALLAAHQALDPAALAEALRADQVLPPRPVVDPVSGPIFPSWDEMRGQRFLVSLLVQRYLAETPADPLADAHRLLSACDRIGTDASGTFVVRCNALRLVLGAIDFRRPLITHGQDGLARAIHDQRARLLDDLRRVARGDLVWRLAFLHDVERGMRESGVPYRGWEPPLLRLGRAGAIRRQLEWLDVLAVPGRTLPALRVEALRIQPEYFDQPIGPRQATNRLLSEYLRLGGIDSALRLDLRAALLIAELTGDGWPQDPFAPGRRLRGILRDGRIIAAYSLGPDGIDGGALRGDWIVPLQGKVDRALTHTTAPGRGD